MPYLSHYTSRGGLEGIAETHSLWGTNFLHVNDSSEFLYPWRVLMQDAAREALSHIPDDQKRPHYDMETEALRLESVLRDSMKSGDGYGDLYITSFARAASEDQERRGILTLWDRYTRHEGYCLQFERRDLEHIMQLDSWRSNYGALGFKEVSYGIDRNEYNYKQLRFQMAQNMIVQMLRMRPDVRVEPKWQNIGGQDYLARQILNFCAAHKDPCFEDEREVRLFGCPLPRPEARVLLGIAFPKPIRTTEHGKRYVVFGENWRPGISPRRIIVGTKADPNIGALVARFPNPPEVAYANLSIA
jgi:hypothetical protein